MPLTRSAARTASGLMSWDSDISVPMFGSPRNAPSPAVVRIEPPDGAVAAPIDDIHPSAAGVLEDDHRSACQIELGHGRSDRKRLERLRSLRDDHGIEAFSGFFLFVARSLHSIVGNLALAVPRDRVALETLLVASEATFDLVGGLFETRIGLMRAAFRVQGDAGAQPQRAVRAIARTFACDHDVTADRSVEIMGDHRLDFFQDMLTQKIPRRRGSFRILSKSSMIGLIFEASSTMVRRRSSMRRVRRLLACPHPASPRTILGGRFGGSVRSLSRPCQSPCQFFVNEGEFKFRPRPPANRRARGRRGWATFSACAFPPKRGF